MLTSLSLTARGSFLARQLKNRVSRSNVAGLLYATDLRNLRTRGISLNRCPGRYYMFPLIFNFFSLMYRKKFWRPASSSAVYLTPPPKMRRSEPEKTSSLTGEVAGGLYGRGGTGRRIPEAASLPASSAGARTSARTQISSTYIGLSLEHIILRA